MLRKVLPFAKVETEIVCLDQGTAVYGATHLADLTEEEFKKSYLGFKRSQVWIHQMLKDFEDGII